MLTNRSVSNTRLYGSASGEYNRASNPEKSDQAGDVLHQQFLAAKAVRRNPDKTTPLDAAAAQYRLLHKSSRRNLSGNPEGIGFAEQVGSQSATADRLQDSQAAVTHEGVAGEECITQSSLIDDMKNKLEMGVPIGGDQHNWGGGEGGKPRFDTAKRTLWTSAVKGKSAADHSTLGQVSDSNRKAKERVGAEQNLRTKHRFSAVTSDESKEGNIVADSVPPKVRIAIHLFRCASPDHRDVLLAQRSGVTEVTDPAKVTLLLYIRSHKGRGKNQNKTHHRHVLQGCRQHPTPFVEDASSRRIQHRCTSPTTK